MNNDNWDEIFNKDSIVVTNNYNLAICNIFL